MPKRIKIGPDWVLIERNDVSEEFEGLITEGTFDPDLDVITIQTGLPIGRARKALMHEVEHAIWNGTDISERIGSTVEEKVIAATTGIRLATWRDNPSLIRYLTERNP